MARQPSIGAYWHLPCAAVGAPRVRGGAGSGITTNELVFALGRWRG